MPSAFQDFAAELTGVETTDQQIQRLAAARDASHYLMIPQGIVRPRSADQVAAVMSAAAAHGLPVTFRSGGTSLSGQAVTDGIMVDTRRAFRGIEVLEDGARVRVQPGATIGAVNAALARHQRMLGPDPASSSACTIGGVVANNSSGMAAGVESTTYNTLESMVFILPSGTTIDTAAPDADQKLHALEPEIHAGLARLRRRVLDDPESMRILKHQYSMKNTMGYGLNSLLDYEEPVRILEHLLIGSEGTLGFVAEATYRTVPIHPEVVTGLLVFPDLITATTAVPALVRAGMATAELLDATSLKVAQRGRTVAQTVAAVDVVDHAALLVEFQGDTPADVRDLQEAATDLLRSLETISPATMTDDAAERARLWAARKGLYATVAGNRPSGTNALLEDVVVPVDVLGQTCAELNDLFERFGYQDSVIFGHAKDGNIHFMLNEQFGRPDHLARYQEFTEEMVQLILDNRGSLKAEHGTGRIMAPYIERQFGTELHQVMREIKTLLDPIGILNPGVIITDDPQAYVRNLKVAETVEEEVDRCVECGYCEPVCPSKDLTLTPRQRIVLRRERAAADARGDRELTAAIDAAWDYQGEQTCAVDGMCMSRCPVGINTGDLIRRLRGEKERPAVEAGWTAAARGWGIANTAAGLGLSAAKALPAPVPRAATDLARSVFGEEQVPRYHELLPAGGRRRAPREDAEASFVLFPACVNAMFGGVDACGEAADGASWALMQIARRAGLRWSTPRGIGAMCCGTPWKSKGFSAGYEIVGKRVLDGLWEATRGGELPVVCDASSCTEGLVALQQRMRDTAPAAPDAETSPEGDREIPRLQFVDAVQFAAEQIMPRLQVRRRVETLMLHPTCSLTQLGLQSQLESLGQAAAEEAVVPLNWGCCAYAGDRGMLHPELTASATRAEAAEVTSREYTAYASANRTCEQGMTEATGKTYQNILQLLEWATR